MSKKLLFLLPALLGAFMMFMPACGESDPCKDIDCGAYGDCFEGDCVCNVGYEKDAEGLCTIEMRAKFIDTYNTTESCTPPSTGSYSNQITASGSDVSKVVISNFGDSGQNVVATVDGNTITVPSTTITAFGQTFDIQASGSITGNVVTITYEARQGGALQFTCTKTMTKV